MNSHFGPSNIATHLKRYHDMSIPHLGVWRILKRLEVNRLPASQRYKSLDRRWHYEKKQLPGHQVQIDVTFLIETLKVTAKKKLNEFTAIGDCTRFRVSRIYPQLNQKRAIQFVGYVLRAPALPRQGLTDT